MPTGVGAYINFGDIIIFISSSLLGPLGGFICGGVGSALADIIYVPMFAPLTFIVKGIEGLLCGSIIWLFKKKVKNDKVSDYVSYVVSFITSGLWMMLGYFFGTWIMLGVINNGEYSSGLSIALLNIPNDSIQVSVSVVTGFVLILALLRIKYIKQLQDDFTHKMHKSKIMMEDKDQI